MLLTQQMQPAFEPFIFAHSLSTICGFKRGGDMKMERYFRYLLNNYLTLTNKLNANH